MRTIQYYQLKAQYNYHVSVSAPARRSRAPQGPIAFVAFVATASLLAAAAVTSSSGIIVVPAPLPPRGVAVVFGGVSLLSSSFAFVLPTLSRRRPASSSLGWGKTTGPPRPPPAMSFPSGDVVVTPFVGADDGVDGTVAPPQGLDFFKDVEGDYYDGLQNEDGEDRIAPGSAILRPHQTWGGGMTDAVLTMLTAGIATSHLRMHRRELRR